MTASAQARMVRTAVGRIGQKRAGSPPVNEGMRLASPPGGAPRGGGAGRGRGAAARGGGGAAGPGGGDGGGIGDDDGSDPSRRRARSRQPLAGGARLAQRSGVDLPQRLDEVALLGEVDSHDGGHEAALGDARLDPLTKGGAGVHL